METRTSTTLRLTLPCSKTLTPMDYVNSKSTIKDSNPKTSYYAEEISNKTDLSCGGWSFLQALSNVSHGDNKESIYVHPQTKRSSLILSEKSLQLCTENLGSETGTDIVENGIDLLSSSSSSSLESNTESAGDSPTREEIKAARGVFGGKRNKRRDFPPPLTTIRGLESLRVRPHREEGRLVIKAVRVPPSASCFKAERSHGRLRLHLLKNESTRFDYEEEEEEEEEYDDAYEKEDVESEMEEEEEENEERDGEKMGLRGYDRMSRCREGECENNEMFILESIWVASS